MALRLDEETIERLRSLGPERAVDAARNVVLATQEAGSEDFLDLYEQLVEEGILSWHQVEQYDPGFRG
jgi:hypothetical protein